MTGKLGSMKDNENALREALESCALDNHKIMFYDNEEDFDTLWEIINKKETLSDSFAILAHDIACFSSRNLNPWTSIDAWCLALSVALPNSTCCIHLLDLRKNPDKLLTKTVDEVCSHFLNRYAPVASKGGKVSYLDEFAKNVAATGNYPVPKELDASNSSVASSRFDKFEAIRKHAILLIDENDRHDNSNDLGAMIMEAGLEEPPKISSFEKREKATRILIRTLLTPVKRFKKFSDYNGLNVWLIDDKSENGYLTLLKALGLEAHGHSGVFNAKVEDGSTDHPPKKLLNKEIHLLKKQPNRNFFDPDFIFLDLRLWTGDGNQKNAIDKYKNLATENRISNRSLKSLSEKGDSSRRILSLLPMLIARLDPSLPIILFSSTQHRSVTQAVRNQQNIITVFAKPYIGGNDPDDYDPTTILDALKISVKTATKMQGLREVWKNACEKWDKKNLCLLKWDESWPDTKLKEEQSPIVWLREDWLPLAQRGEYLMAAASPWTWLRKTLGDAPLAILAANEKIVNENQDTSEIYGLVSLIRKTGQAPLLQEVSTKDQQELACLAATALVKLIAEWTKIK